MALTTSLSLSNDKRALKRYKKEEEIISNMQFDLKKTQETYEN